jgi:hypothetical protein
MHVSTVSSGRMVCIRLSSPSADVMEVSGKIVAQTTRSFPNEIFTERPIMVSEVAASPDNAGPKSSRSVDETVFVKIELSIWSVPSSPAAGSAAKVAPTESQVEVSVAPDA